ncbi:unnamed protein product [Allacma fusca]|uniref:CRAL-TRIO domain-containing protein n=1 Tax=Allacma fusca TaxID=39272 RepID=A0A8J2KA24_9HEXA|nr:unnamed protein product [Allacma fusca]
MEQEKWAKILLSVALIYSGLAIGVTEAVLAPIWFEFVARIGAKPPIRRLILMSFYWSTKFSNNVFGRIYSKVHRDPIAPILFLLMTSSILVINHTTPFQFGALAIILTTAYGGFYATGTLWLLDIHGREANQYLHLQNLLWFLGRNLPSIVFPMVGRTNDCDTNIICQRGSANNSLNYPTQIKGTIIDGTKNMSAIEDIVYPNKKDFYLVENYQGLMTTLISVAFLAHLLSYLIFAWRRDKQGVDYEEDTISNFPVVRFLLGVLTVSPTVHWTKNGVNFLQRFPLQSGNLSGDSGSYVSIVTVSSFSLGSLTGIVLSRRFQAEWMLLVNVGCVILGSAVLLLANSLAESRVLGWIGIVLMGLGMSTSVPNAVSAVMLNFKMSPFVGATFFSFNGVNAHGLNVAQSYLIMMAAPKAEELDLLPVFRARIEDLNLNDFLNSDMELLRWIRAREWNLDQAELMLRKHMKWREEVNFDEITSWDLPEPFQGLLPEELIGFDEDNCPILLSALGKWDLRRVAHEGSPDYLLKSQWKWLAEMQDLMRRKVTREGVPVTQVCSLNDMNGISITQASLQVLRTLSDFSRSFEANFPESLKMYVVFNAPWFFSVFFKVARPFLSEKTLKKIHVFGSNREEWMGFLKQVVPDDVLPAAYGGSNSNQVCITQ